LENKVSIAIPTADKLVTNGVRYKIRDKRVPRWGMTQWVPGGMSRNLH